MRITPLDIYQREFSRKKLGGLDDTEVYDFLKKVGREYEAVYAECKNLKDQNQRLTNQMKDYLELEKTLKQTLISAQKASADTKNNAEKEAELIVKEAEIQAERIMDEARTESEIIGKEIRELKRQKRMLKVELRTVLESYLCMLNEEPPTMGSRTATMAAPAQVAAPAPAAPAPTTAPAAPTFHEPN
ncbi:MAG: DivIVA domain-containing protein [Candidatus Riflebacteria bacterium]|nr:DivIVA domain-containing protein [Candidatus Riflebacteria bacterium]